MSKLAHSNDETMAEIECNAMRAAGDLPEPCTQEALDMGCTCRIPSAGAHDIDPPEPRRDDACPLHGRNRDPDEARERARDRAEDR